MDYQVHELSNGIRIIHKQVDSIVAHCGVFINAGSRDEENNEHGLAHFIEHVIFKGTKKRKAYHVLSRLEDVGGEINAYTTKEDTCIHASFMSSHYGRTLELFSDILFNSVFPAKELDREREVIIDEINSYKDSPSELIFDDFDEMIFSGSSLGRSILGTPKQLKRFAREDISRFMERNYRTDEIVISSTGNIPMTRLIRLFERYFGHIPGRLNQRVRPLFDGYAPTSKTVNKKTFQTHCILGSVAYDLKDKRRTSLHLMNNILGGPCLNSRLTMALRERKGYAYNVESSYTPYSDTGIFSIYFGTDKGYLEKSLDIIRKESRALREKPLGLLQLKRAKLQITGQLAIANESLENQMLSMGKSLLVYNKVDSLEEMYRKIELITAHEIMEVANDILDMDKMSKLIYS